MTGQKSANIFYTRANARWVLFTPTYEKVFAGYDSRANKKGKATVMIM
jgi:hypothetical protein